MPNVPLGSQKTDQATTPTLRQWAKRNDGKCPNQSTVTVIFLPNKAPNYTLVCEHGFRVSVLEDNPLHGIISDGLADWSSELSCLVVEIVNGEKGHWNLAVNTDELCDWEEKNWGYKITVKEKPKSRTKK